MVGLSDEIGMVMEEVQNRRGRGKGEGKEVEGGSCIT